MAGKVLLVESDAKRRIAIRDALGACGLDVRESASSTEAMGILKSESVAGLVVADEARHLALRGLCAQVKRGTPEAPMFVLLGAESDPGRVSASAGPDAVLFSVDATAEHVATRVGSAFGARTPDAWRYEKVRPVRKARLWESHLVRGPKGEDGMLTQLSDQFAKDEDLRTEFLGAATDVAALEHPNLPRIRKVGGSTDIPFFVADCRPGETLRDLERRTRESGGSLSWRGAAHVASQLAGALDHAHRASFVHGALSPDAIWIGADGHVELLYLGVAGFLTALERTLRMPVGMVVHQPYLAPEQLRDNQLDGRTDVFLVGAILHELLAGRPLFTRETPNATREAILTGEIPELRGVPSDLVELTMTCLERNPAYRPQSAGSLRTKLETVLAGRSSPPRSAPHDEDDTQEVPGASGLLSRWFSPGSGGAAPAGERTREPTPVRKAAPGPVRGADPRAELAALFARNR